MRGALVRYAYRLGRQGASGILTLTAPASRTEVFVLRRGGVVIPDGELARRTAIARLARLAALEVGARFEGGAGLSPPGAQPTLPLAQWARTHLEQQLDRAVGERVVRELAGMRLSVKPDLAPEAADEADRRMLAAMAQPRRLDQIWPLARTPRFRLLAFIHFLRGVDALAVEGVVAEQSAPTRVLDPRRAAAARLLGVDDPTDEGAVKRAYRRLARALHPDLHPTADELHRRSLERRFAEVTAAYEALS